MEKTELIISYFTQFFVPYLRSLNRHKYKDEKTIFRFQTKVIAELLNVYRSAFRTSQNSFEFQITLKIEYSHLRSQSSLHVERACKTTGNFSVFSATQGTKKHVFSTLVSITSNIVCSWKLRLACVSDSSNLMCDPAEWFKFRGLMHAPIFHVFSR